MGWFVIVWFRCFTFRYQSQSVRYRLNYNDPRPFRSSLVLLVVVVQFVLAPRQSSPNVVIPCRIDWKEKTVKAKRYRLVL